MLYREIFSPYRAVNTHRLGYKNQSVNAVRGNIQSVPPSKHSVSAIKTSQLMLYREIFSPYQAVNTHRLGYKNQSVNAVQGNIQSVPRSKHTPYRL
jgi:hypothetical protein